MGWGWGLFSWGSSYILKRQRSQRSNCQHTLDYRKSYRIPEKISTSVSLTLLKALECVDHKKLWKILKEMGIPDYLTCLLRNLYVGQEAIVRTRHGTIDWFKIGKGLIKAAYCYPVNLTYMQSTSCETPG